MIDQVPPPTSKAQSASLIRALVFAAAFSASVIRVQVLPQVPQYHW
jgi:hypothetical protein